MDYAYQGRHPPTQLTAVVASQSPGNATWYTDSGATDHITSDINNLTSRSDYQGPDQVSVGNGAGLRISHMLCQALFLLLLLNFIFQICYMSLTLLQI